MSNQYYMKFKSLNDVNKDRKVVLCMLGKNYIYSPATRLAVLQVGRLDYH